MICSIVLGDGGDQQPAHLIALLAQRVEVQHRLARGHGQQILHLIGQRLAQHVGRIACVVYSRTRMRRLATPSTTSLLLKRAPVHSCRSATATAPGSSTSESFAASGGSGTSPYARAAVYARA